MSHARAATVRGFAAGLLALLAACSSPGPQQPDRPAGDPQVVEASSAARLAYERGHYAQARTLYRRALTRAQAIDSPGQAADAAYNLAMSEIGLRDYDAADRLLVQAEYDAARDSADTADIRLLRAKVAYLRERLPEALALASDVVASNASPRLVLQARILRGQAFCDTGDLPGAKAELQSAKNLVESTSIGLTPSIGADLDKLEGTIARLDGNVEAAAHFFDSEVQLLRTARRHRDMAHALARSAEAHLRAGRPASAAERFFLAGRSLAGQGDFSSGEVYIASSEAAARAAGDEAARSRARRLLEEISRRAAP